MPSSLPRNDAFFAAAAKPAGGRSLQSALVSARQTGVLQLKGRSLPHVPAEAFDIASVPLPEGVNWWETRETIERLDLSENALKTIPDALRALTMLKAITAHTSHASPSLASPRVAPQACPCRT